MGGSGAFGFGTSKSKSKSGTKFNTDFLDKFDSRYGPAPLATQADLPKPESVFTPRVEQQARGLGIGKAPEQIQGPAAVSTTNIQAPTLGPAARVEIPGGSREAYQNSLFGAQFNPVARQFDRTADLQRRELAGNVAGGGLQGSAAGIGLIQRQAQQQSEARAGLASDAANRAATQAYGFEQEAALADAGRRQETMLKQAGMDIDAQTSNAANILTGNVASARNYIDVIGLNIDQVSQAREAFMKLLGMREDDMERVDNATRTNLNTQFNQWLQTFGAVQSASEFGKSNSSSFRANMSGGGGVMGGGGTGDGATGDGATG